MTTYNTMYAPGFSLKQRRAVIGADKIADAWTEGYKTWVKTLAGQRVQQEQLDLQKENLELAKVNSEANRNNMAFNQGLALANLETAKERAKATDIGSIMSTGASLMMLDKMTGAGMTSGIGKLIKYPFTKVSDAITGYRAGSAAAQVAQDTADLGGTALTPVVDTATSPTGIANAISDTAQGITTYPASTAVGDTLTGATGVVDKAGTTWSGGGGGIGSAMVDVAGEATGAAEQAISAMSSADASRYAAQAAAEGLETGSIASSNLLSEGGNLGLEFAPSVGSVVGEALPYVGSAVQVYSDFANPVENDYVGATIKGVVDIAGSAATAYSVGMPVAPSSVPGLLQTATPVFENTLGKGVDAIDSAVSSTASTLSDAGSAIVDFFFCFAKGTMVILESGMECPIELLDIGDRLLLGGGITALGKALGGEMYRYHGELVEGSHAAYEDGKWIRVHDSKDAVRDKDSDGMVVYPIVCENHLMVVGGKVFADMVETPLGWSVSDEERIEWLNGQPRRNEQLSMHLETLRSRAGLHNAGRHVEEVRVGPNTQ